MLNEKIMSKYRFGGMILLCGIVGFALRCIGLDVETSDMRVLTSWHEQLEAAGPGLDALLEYRGDYPLTYITIIWLVGKLPIDFMYALKASSILLDYILAFGFASLVEEIKPSGGKNYCVGFAVVMMLPTVIMNSSVWGQCDSLYATFVVWAIYCIIKERYGMSMVFLGIAFAFKLQTILILPFFLIYYWMEKKFSALYFGIIPLVMILCNIPAIAAGYPISIAFTPYVGLSGGYPWLYYFYPNFWFFFQAAPFYMFQAGAIFCAFTALLIFVVLLVKNNVRITKDRIIPIAMWTLYTCVMFLPTMHERYTYIAELFAIALLLGNLKRIWLPVGLIACVIPKYLWAFDIIGNPRWLQAVSAAGNIVIYLLFTMCLWWELFVEAGGKGDVSSGKMVRRIY